LLPTASVLVDHAVYSDFESILVPLENNITNKTIKYQKHEVFSGGIYLKCSYDNSSFYDSFRGMDVTVWFTERLKSIAKCVHKKINDIILMKDKDIPIIDLALKCHICNKHFSDNDKQSKNIVRDHDHFTGEFRGFAHCQCNLNYRKKYFIPIVCHNLSGYDSHFLIEDISKIGKISLLPINQEKYISFTLVDDDTGEEKRKTKWKMQRGRG
jgi:hypothetical protein